MKIVIRRLHQWRVSSTIIDKKSVFQGHALRVESIQQADDALKELKMDKKISKATHNITALRLSDGTEKSDDDGEPPAGERILNLLKLQKREDVFVVVTRWYGGVKLGGARFKHIGKCADEALKKL